MDIGAVHTKLVSLMTGLAITAPVAMTVRQVWPYTPPARIMIDPPSIIFWHDLTDAKFEPGGMVEQQYNIHLQLFATKADVEANVGAAIALAFLDAIFTRISAHVTLEGVAQVVRGMRGGNQEGGTLTVFTRNAIPYVGLDLILPITLKDVRTRGA